MPTVRINLQVFAEFPRPFPDPRTPIAFSGPSQQTPHEILLRKAQAYRAIAARKRARMPFTAWPSSASHRHTSLSHIHEAVRETATALKWWAMTDSNRRHPRCKRGALPTELIALPYEHRIIGPSTERKHGRRRRLPPAAAPQNLVGLRTAATRSGHRA